MQNKKEIKSFEQRCRKYLKKNESEEYEFMFILARRKEGHRGDMLALAVNENDDGIHLFKNDDVSRQLVAELVNFDDDFLSYLQEGYQIERMNPRWHYNVWMGVSEMLDDSNIDSKEGLGLYLDFCKKNHITKEFLEEKEGYPVFPDLIETGSTYLRRLVDTKKDKPSKQR